MVDLLDGLMMKMKVCTLHLELLAAPPLLLRVPRFAPRPTTLDLHTRLLMRCRKKRPSSTTNLLHRSREQPLQETPPLVHLWMPSCRRPWALLYGMLELPHPTVSTCPAAYTPLPTNLLA